MNLCQLINFSLKSNLMSICNIVESKLFAFHASCRQIGNLIYSLVQYHELFLQRLRKNLNVKLVCNMDRKTFLKHLGLIPLTGLTMNLNKLNVLSQELSNTDRMPVLFVGHGSLMNAIEENQFAKLFRNIAKTLPKPNAMLCISANWYQRNQGNCQGKA